MTKVSIIIPIYNVAPFLEQCLDSVRNQNFKEFEVLLIDDCGTDESVTIAERFILVHGLQEHGWRILHHSHNRGLSAARNTGMKAAQGEWVYFLDSDDYISADAISSLYEIATCEQDIEMAIGGINTLVAENLKNINGRIWDYLPMQEGVCKQSVLNYFLDGSYYMMAWNKLIRTDFLRQHSLYFKEGLIHEDDLWSFCCACWLKKISVIHNQTYFYRIHDNSILGDSREKIHVFAKNTVLSEMIDYTLLNGLGYNKPIFIYIYFKLKGLLLSESFVRHKEYVRDLFEKFHNTHFWTISQLWHNAPAKRDFFYSVMFKLPLSLGVYFVPRLIRSFR